MKQTLKTLIRNVKSINGNSLAEFATVTAQGNSDAHSTAILTDLSIVDNEGWEDYDKTHAAVWASVFGKTNADALLPANVSGAIDDADGTAAWILLMGGESLKSRFQDGHYVYSVVAGGGSGDKVYPPVLYVGDIENMTDFNNVLEP